MIEHEDPLRLLDSLSQADPALRDALRVASREVPSHAQVQALANQVTGTVTRGALTASGVGSGWWKGIAGLLTITGAVLGGVVWNSTHRAVGLRATEQTAASPSSLAQSEVSASGSPNGSASSAPAGAGVGPAISASNIPSGAGERVTPQPSFAAGAVAASKAEHESDGDARANSAPRRSVFAPTRSRETPDRHAEASAHAKPTTNTPQRATSTELDLIARAQSALPSNPRQTLALLAEHRAAYPHGDFAEERDVLRLDALHRMRWQAQMREQATQFLDQYPRSLHVEHVRRLLAASDD